MANLDFSGVHQINGKGYKISVTGFKHNICINRLLSTWTREKSGTGTM